MRRSKLLPWCLLLLGACAAPAVDRAIEHAAADLVTTPALAGGRVGLLVVDTGSGTVLASHLADQGFLPASNQKLLSAAIALHTLGPEFRFPTRVETAAPLCDGVLDGDLWLVGGGDPTLGGRLAANPLEPMEQLASAIAAIGVREVRGDIVGDGSCQGDETRGLGWQWDYLDADYAAPFSGLCFHENVVRWSVGPMVGSPAGEPVTRAVRREPEVGHPPFPEVAPDAVAAAGDRPVGVAVPDPPVFAAAALRTALLVRGIPVGGEAVAAGKSRQPAPDRRILATLESPPLASILMPLLKDSQNLYAEQVWRTAARIATGDGSTVASERHGKAMLAELGVDCRGLVLADGSGLSRRNLVRPRQLAAVLRAMHDGPFRDEFFAALPVAGEEGTLRGRLRDGPARGHVRAKTGYISRVVCLSGIVERPEPTRPPLLFVVMLNDFTCSDAEAKAAVDGFVQRLAAFAGW